ncbi:MAG: hypothetical protein AAFU85_26075 [Planctomycetota bacterium]
MGAGFRAVPQSLIRTSSRASDYDEKAAYLAPSNLNNGHLGRHWGFGTGFAKLSTSTNFNLAIVFRDADLSDAGVAACLL